MFTCVDCDFSSARFKVEVTGTEKGAFTYQAKCPICGSHKVNATGPADALRITSENGVPCQA